MVVRPKAQEMSCRGDIDRRSAVRVLKFIGAGSACRIGSGAGDACDLVLAGEGGKRRQAVPQTLIDDLVRADLVAVSGDRLAVSGPGRAWLRRALTGGDDAFGAQHRSLSERRIRDERGEIAAVQVNEDESPLGWLRRRRGRDGRPLLDEAQFSAGERLRAEYTKGNMLPRITANWSADVNQGRRRSGEAGGVADLTDAALAARGRVTAALEAVGPELAGVLVDVCCFLKGLEDVERERCWPARSGKLVLSLALSRLARHYGFADDGDGRGRRRTIRHWARGDFPPDIDSSG